MRSLITRPLLAAGLALGILVPAAAIAAPVVTLSQEAPAAVAQAYTSSTQALNVGTERLKIGYTDNTFVYLYPGQASNPNKNVKWVMSALSSTVYAKREGGAWFWTGTATWQATSGWKYQVKGVSNA